MEELGRRCLAIMDDIGLVPEGVFWLFDDEEQRWRFYVVTSLFDYLGPWKLYFRLNDAMPRRLAPGEWDSLACFLGSPEDRMAAALREAVQSAGECACPQLVAVESPDGDATALVYRMRRPEPETSRQERLQAFRQGTRRGVSATAPPRPRAPESEIAVADER
jgi:hypothetical protein